MSKAFKEQKEAATALSGVFNALNTFMGHMTADTSDKAKSIAASIQKISSAVSKIPEAKVEQMTDIVAKISPVGVATGKSPTSDLVSLAKSPVAGTITGDIRKRATERVTFQTQVVNIQLPPGEREMTPKTNIKIIWENNESLYSAVEEMFNRKARKSGIVAGAIAGK